MGYLYEQDYVEYLQHQIKRQAEMIDSQNIIIHNLIENKYGEELTTTYERKRKRTTRNDTER